MMLSISQTGHSPPQRQRGGGLGTVACHRVASLQRTGRELIAAACCRVLVVYYRGFQHLRSESQIDMESEEKERGAELALARSKKKNSFIFKETEGLESANRLG